jgi:hypothetical protein
MHKQPNVVSQPVFREQVWETEFSQALKTGSIFFWVFTDICYQKQLKMKRHTFGLQYPLGTNMLGNQQQNGSAKYRLVISFRTKLVNLKCCGGSRNIEALCSGLRESFCK